MIRINMLKGFGKGRVIHRAMLKRVRRGQRRLWAATRGGWGKDAQKQVIFGRPGGSQ